MTDTETTERMKDMKLALFRLNESLTTIDQKIALKKFLESLRAVKEASEG